MSKELEVKFIRADISEELAEQLLFDVFDLLLREDFTVLADKEERPKKINKN